MTAALAKPCAKAARDALCTISPVWNSMASASDSARTAKETQYLSSFAKPLDAMCTPACAKEFQASDKAISDACAVSQFPNDEQFDVDQRIVQAGSLQGGSMFLGWQAACMRDPGSGDPCGYSLLRKAMRDNLRVLAVVPAPPFPLPPAAYTSSTSSGAKDVLCGGCAVAARQGLPTGDSVQHRATTDHAADAKIAASVKDVCGWSLNVNAKSLAEAGLKVDDKTMLVDVPFMSGFDHGGLGAGGIVGIVLALLVILVGGAFLWIRYLRQGGSLLRLRASLKVGATPAAFQKGVRQTDGT
ncbi:hypothetical protein AMAG_14672 [Allomyces macrogynus ATCC 38327]|uniref:Uncharacterized protein n=1 Tax=Allomyces macrogynus (strain ATCC 38327) TaxID=578462 RepID=A0A0L0T744_ALLM3|nr:hypothetical protein AMAG_14672 [Allomyces macrogynus ATCC 38327]|eukprot:KNE70550.1 hypothetical protein AMAG_14672 [Allomyces macrogynus ATCC 38327]